MHLSVITEPGMGTCACGATTRGVRLHVFSSGAGAEGPFYCMACLLRDDISSDIELEVPEAEESDKRKILRVQKKRSQEQELELAEELGAQMQKASGAMAGSKGDVRKKGVIRIEAKYTEWSSYSLKLEDLHKISSECRGREKPIFVIDFVERTTRRLTDRFAVVPFYDLKELLDASNQNRRPTK